MFEAKNCILLFLFRPKKFAHKIVPSEMGESVGLINFDDIIDGSATLKSETDDIGNENTSRTSLVPDSGPTSFRSLPPLIRDPSQYTKGQNPRRSSLQNQVYTPFLSRDEIPFDSSNFRPKSLPRGEYVSEVPIKSRRSSFYRTPQSFSDLSKNYYPPGPEIYSRKVFLGGLSIDITEEDIMETFRQFGRLVVDWPRKPQNKAFYPPKGYVFLVFEHESAVKSLLSHCLQDDDNYFLCLSTPIVRAKAAHVRPWRLEDSECFPDRRITIDHRLTVYLIGIPRPMTAKELGELMEKVFGGVGFVGLELDPFLKYPKCQGRVAFTSKDNYVKAITAKFIQLRLREMDKRAEIKPYIVDDQSCERCGRAAPYFCGEVSCLQYLCQGCWMDAHLYPGFQNHKVMEKENWDRRPSIFAPSFV